MNSSCSVCQWRWLDHAPGAKRNRGRCSISLGRDNRPICVAGWGTVARVATWSIQRGAWCRPHEWLDSGERPCIQQ
jgi:hypothetical protein